jgi:hypothetical protein
MPTLILEVTTDTTKLAACSNFPHMFLQANLIHAQNIFERDVDLVDLWSGGKKGSVRESKKIRPI